MATQKAPETASGQGKKSPASGQPETELPASAPRKKRRLLLSLVVVAVAVGGTAAFFYPKLVHAPHGVHNGPILQLASSTLNLSDGHILEVTVACQLTSVANVKTITPLEPRIYNAEISVFSGFYYSELLSLQGKRTARQELLKRIQAIIGTQDGYQQVSEVYFTTFIMQ